MQPSVAFCRYFLFTLTVIIQLSAIEAFSQSPGHASYTSDSFLPGSFHLSGKEVPIVVSINDWAGVKLAAGSLAKDINRVTGKTPQILNDLSGVKSMVIAGTLGKNKWIDDLVKRKKVNVTGIAGKWETYLIQTVQNPFPGVQQALIITGSDKRGTIFGLYDVAAQIGVSPWYWWADVPVKKKASIFIKAGRYTDGEPAVKYRGIFINDEAPAFSGWTKEKFGGVNHHMYGKMFELILRLKGNYLWPAMWGNAFNDDDKLNPVLADEYGIVMGTSHHEPMDRAQQEWKRYGSGAWNYESNKEVLQQFWKKGIENMGTKETIVTVGMRGDGDEPMSEKSNISLLENIVKDQRAILQNVLKKDPSEVPQLWALYKEVQDYYDKGMRVPDDITLLLCDDNWGNIRKLPSLTDKPRKGGYGIYYHFDYVGGPRNYKWLNTNQIAKIWEQMHLAYAYKARQIWIVNVGDLKPMEYPISFFLDYAWNPDRWTAENLPDYTAKWAAQQFGTQHAPAVAQMLTLYIRYNARRKPELLNEKTYSLTNYNEFASVVSNYNKLKTDAELLYTKIDTASKAAFYQLVLHPIQACANLNEMYYETAKNAYYFKLGNAKEANIAAERVKALFENDKKISAFYNKELSGGKWSHMMDQTHIGYESWNDPKSDIMPVVKTLTTGTSTDVIKIQGVSTSFKSTGNEVEGINSGYTAFEAQHYNKAVTAEGLEWKIVPDYGNTLSGVMPWPVTMSRQKVNKSGPHLEYVVDLKDTGHVSVTAYISPALDFKNADGLHYAISLDDEKPQLIKVTTKVDSREWAAAVSDNVRKLTTKHRVAKPGKHIVKYWMVDPGVVLQRVVVDAGGLLPSYLGPPESRSK